MLNRRHIRIKVMQSLYAFNGTESDDLSKDEKFLFYSIDGMYDLYLSLLALLTEIHKKGKDYHNKLQNKLSASGGTASDHLKFSQNQLLDLISSNKMLQERIAKQKLNFWELDSEYVDILFKSIINLSKSILQFINSISSSTVELKNLFCPTTLSKTDSRYWMYSWSLRLAFTGLGIAFSSF